MRSLNPGVAGIEHSLLHRPFFVCQVRFVCGVLGLIARPRLDLLPFYGFFMCIVGCRLVAHKTKMFSERYEGWLFAAQLLVL